MSYALFDDAGKFLAGRVMSEADSSMQIELDSGKRVKVKAAHVLLRFKEPVPAALISQAQQLSQDIDLDLAWEFAPEGDFSFVDLARDYFDASAGAAHQAAALFRLFEAPHYFRRMGKGQFRKAPQESVKAALLGIERKRQVAEQIEAWALELIEGRCPQAVREQLYRILFKPDKNAPEYKAVIEAAKRSKRAPLDLLKGAGAITSAYQFHWKRFLFEQFPSGTRFPVLQAPAIEEDLTLSSVRAFSIDDSSTTEIDDALSVQGLGTGVVTVGIHIAAPGLAITPGSPVDQLALQRLSTVYMPGHKLTMLPDHVVQAYSLDQGRECPTVSLYVRFDESSLERLGHETRLERVSIEVNLRHDVLDEQVTEQGLEEVLRAGAAPVEASIPFLHELAFLHHLAQQLKAQREVVRGKPENFNRPDYSFKLEGREEASAEPLGDEMVVISERRRGAPLDLLVAEMMILANSTWGAWLAELGVPGIYRSQASMAPGIKVRMGTRPAPHAGMGVSHYTWASSPLRRYVDLVNQWQIIACARHGRTAALAAPFKPKDAQLLSIIPAFDAAYTAYNDFQRGIERYWTLRWIDQNAVGELQATVIKDGLARCESLPLVFKVTGAEQLPRGTRLKAKVAGMDLLTLDLHASLLERLDETAQAADVSDDDADDDDEVDAGSALTLAIDMNEADDEASAGSGAAPASNASTQPSSALAAAEAQAAPAA